MSEIGKNAKYKGDPHPRVSRRIDPEPGKPTPKKEAKPKVFKRFGFTYECRWVSSWRQAGKYWYETAEQRDQALEAAKKKNYHWQRNFKKIQRK